MRNRILQSCLVAWFLVMVGADAGNAADIGVINARLGVARAPRFKGECWAQLAVTIRNKGAQANAEVQFTPLSLGFARSTTLFRKKITVPAESEIEFSFPVISQADEKFIIELYVDGVATDKQQFSASMVNIGDPFAMILDDGVTAYSYFKELKIENRKVTLTMSQARDLPGFWEILDGIAVIVMGDIDVGKLQQPQIDSLRTWVEGGGILVVSTDERWERLRGSFVEDWLPVRMYGARPIDSLEPFGERYGKPIAMNENLMMCESLPSSGRVLLTMQGLPLLAYRKMGLGAVVYSAVRLDATTLTKWGGLGAVWEEIFTLREKPIEVRRTMLERNREQMLSNITGLPVPEPQFVATLLVGYIGVVALAFVLFRSRRKLEWAWCSLLLIAPVAAGVYHSIGQSTRQEFRSTLNEISVVRMNGAEATEKSAAFTGWIESFHSLYSAKEATYNVRADTADALVAQGAMAAESSQAVVPSINIMAEDTIVAEKILVNEGGVQSFNSFSTRSYADSIESSLEWGANGLQGEIKNKLGFALQDAVVLFNRQIVALKTLGPGDSRLVQIGDPKNASYTPLQSLGGSSLDVTRKQILENLFTPLNNYNPAQDQPVLIGWADQSVAPLSDEAHHLRRNGLVLYVISLPFKRAEGDVLIPKGVCPVRVPSALTFRNGKWVQMQGFASGSEIEIDFRIPPDVRDLTAESIKGYFEIENPGGDMEASIAAFDWSAGESGQWVALGAARDFTLSEPLRFVLRPVGRIRLKLSVSAIRPRAPVGETPSLRAFRWQVKDVDIEIRGKLS